MGQTLHDMRTWLPANIAGIDLDLPNEMTGLLRQMAAAGELSANPKDPNFHGHFRCLGLLENRPFVRDRRTGQCFWSSYEVEEA